MKFLFVISAENAKSAVTNQWRNENQIKTKQNDLWIRKVRQGNGICEREFMDEAINPVSIF